MGPSRPAARRRFGQHFLEPAWAGRLVDAMAPHPDDTFLEIGPGRGAITRLLVARARRVVAVEIDRDLAALLRSGAPPGLEVVEADFLTVDPARLDLPSSSRVAGNLPYNVATPILFRLISLAGSLPLRDATLMVQKEVADRLVASPGSRDYGPLTIFVALGATVTRVMTLPPGAFRPAPKVTSSVIRLQFPSAQERPSVPATFERLVRGLFNQRRKTIGNALRPVAQSLGRSAAALLASAGLDPRRRPETLSVEDLLGLARLLEARPPASN